MAKVTVYRAINSICIVALQTELHFILYHEVKPCTIKACILLHVSEPRRKLSPVFTQSSVTGAFLHLTLIEAILAAAVSIYFLWPALHQELFAKGLFRWQISATLRVESLADACVSTSRVVCRLLIEMDEHAVQACVHPHVLV